MIRILVGTMLQVNDGKLKLSDLDGILAARDRRCAGKTAMACGLYLNRVFYDDAYQTEPKKRTPDCKKGDGAGTRSGMDPVKYYGD